jgi:dihydromethanopterin reductase (acceptor)
MKIAWGITGAGHLTPRKCEILVELSKEHEVTVLTLRSW